MEKMKDFLKTIFFSFESELFSVKIDYNSYNSIFYNNEFFSNFNLIVGSATKKVYYQFIANLF